MRIGVFAALGVALFAGGCVTIEERRALDAERCRGYGFRTGTEAFAQCMLDIDLDRSASRRALVYRDFSGPSLGFGYGYGFRRW
jgi:hypothetical protein